MELMIEAQPVPLEVKDGVARVAGSRVTLDTVIGAFNDGATAEEIAQKYPTLSLGDIYAVIAYYLREKPAVDAYLQDYRRQGKQIQREMEARFNPVGIRARLLARRNKSE